MKYWLLLLIAFCIVSCGDRAAVSSSYSQTSKYNSAKTIVPSNGDNTALYQEVTSWIGTPHRLGGMSKSGVDCSGFVYQVYYKVYGVRLNRTANAMMRSATFVKKADLKEGDLVFFYVGKGSKTSADHVGIYLKNGKFAHASSSRGVIISSLDEAYYKKAWLRGGRVR